MSTEAPAPWHVLNSRYGSARIVAANDAIVADMFLGSDDCQDDAAMIAAAPDLADALRGLYDYARGWPAEDGSRFHDLLERAAAALAKVPTP